MFPVTSCSSVVGSWPTAIPTQIAVGGVSLPVPTQQPQSILVLGDTGCRMKDGDFQDCNGNTAGSWGFPDVVSAATEETPDLIVHVGDYVYRESPCPSENAGCDDSPYGDKWATWEADFFKQAAPLLGNAPWIFVRGNHEVCPEPTEHPNGRNWRGFQRFLDGHAFSSDCPLFGDLYEVSFPDAALNFLVLNTAADVKGPECNLPNPLNIEQFQQMFSNAADLAQSKPNEAFFIATHRPFWGLRASAQENGVEDPNPCLRNAIPDGGWPVNVQVALAGHIHLLEALTFSNKPAQIIAGGGGTELVAPPSTAASSDLYPKLAEWSVTPTCDPPPDDCAGYAAYENYGYVMLTRGASQWTAELKESGNGTTLKSFGFGAGTLVAAPGSVFSDDDGSVFENHIEWLAAQGIAKGCNPPTNDRFCPDDHLTRGQMAALLVRALGLTDNGGGSSFVDDDGSVFEADIAKLAAAGITRGCNPPANDRFCPDDHVTRGQMAAFLVRALGYVDDGGGDLFVDDDQSVFAAEIDKLGAARVTKGCNPPTNDRFCPHQLVTRGQTAAFLHRALG